MADIKNFGIKGIASDVQLGKAGGRLVYDVANNRFNLTQADGTTLENLRVGNITEGTWTGTAIGTQYGGTGQDFSASTGIITLASGTASVSNIDLTDANIVNSATQLPVAQGGTGASDSANARINIGLGTIATQDSDNVTLTGGTLDGTVIGGSNAVAITGTTITASTGFVGNVTGNLTGVADEADAFTSAVGVRISGDAQGNANFIAAGEVANVVTTLNTVNSDVGSFGNATAIPTITVNGKGLVTAVTTSQVASNLSISGTSGTDNVQLLDDTLAFAGNTQQLSAAVTNNTVTYSIIDGANIANLTVTGTFTSDDITSQQISIDGDATITGNLTVNGTQTIVNSTTVEVDDATFRVNSDGVSQSAGIEANIAGTIESVLYNPVNSRWELSGNVFTSEDIEASGTVTYGSLSDGTITITGFVDEDNMSSDSATLVPTQQSVKAYVDSKSSAANISFEGDTGSSTFNIETDSFDIAGGTGLSTSAAGTTVTVTLDDTAVTAGTYGNNIAIPSFTVDAQGRITDAGTVNIATQLGIGDDNASTDLINLLSDTLLFSQTANETTVSVTNNTVTIGLVDSPTVSGTVTANIFTDGTATLTGGNLTATDGSFTNNVAVSANVDVANAVVAETFTDGTATITGGDLTATNVSLTDTIDAVTLTDGTATLTGGDLTDVNNVSAVNGTFSGTITDGSASLASGNFTGLANVTANGTITANTFTDGTATLSAGDLTTTGNITAGAVEFDYLSGTGAVEVTDIINDGTLSGASSTNLATAGSLKTYIDVEIDKYDVLALHSDTGNGNVNLNTETLSVLGTAGEIETSVSGNAITIGLPDNVTIGNDLEVVGNTIIDGDLTVNGNSFTVNSTQISITDNMIYLNEPETRTIANAVGDGSNVTYTTTEDHNFYVGESTTITGITPSAFNVNDANIIAVTNNTFTLASTVTDTYTSGGTVSARAAVNPDLGWAGGYNDGTYAHAGIFRDATDGLFKIFDSYVPEPDLSVFIDTSHASFALANFQANDIDAVGTLSFGTLQNTDESISITGFVDEADGITNNDNDTTLPTTAAVVDYVENNAGDGLLLRGTFSADGANSSFEVGTVPNVSARTYYVDKIIVKSSIAVSGGSFNHILIKEDNANGDTILSADDADVGAVGSYLIQHDGEQTLAKNQPVVVEFKQADGTTASIPTTGQLTVSVHYKFV